MAYSREVRFGVVFYGGVSLAIYENGIAEELFHAVHGDGIYGLLKDLTDSDFVVDVISGTSAGGINGIYLAYALANGKDFTQMSKLWRDQGDIQKLLREPSDSETLSVLNSRFYHDELAKAFRNMGPRNTSAGARPSALQELDLFVTGTDVAGDVSTVFDDQGHAIDIKKHNSVFKLSWRGTRKNELNPDYAEELATLACITSCFPVAFAPVGVDLDKLPNLARWGRLRESAPFARATAVADGKFDKVYLDGGILDNKPFSYTTDTIFRRTANRPVQRLLFYVEPDPERFRAVDRTAPPKVVKAAVDSLVSIPGYESIGEDLAAINLHNEQVSRMNTLMGVAENLAKAARNSIEDIGTFPQNAADVYITARLLKIRDRAVEGLLNTGGWRDCFRDPKERRAGRILVESFLAWKNDGGAQTILENFDVYFRLRRLFHLTYTIYDPAAPSQTTESDDLTSLWNRLNHLIKLVEILEWALEWYVDHVPIEWKQLDNDYRDPVTGNEIPPDHEKVATEKWGQVQRGMSAVLDNTHVQLPEREEPTGRQEFYINIKNQIEELAKRVPREKEPVPTGNLLRDCDARLNAIMRERSQQNPQDRIAQAFRQFLYIDQQIFPSQFASGVYSRDQIRIQRLSPIDAKRGHSGQLQLEEKVAGRTFGAFGGFFKKSWRANDIMWGRLDAVSQFVECLLTQNRVAELQKWRSLGQRVPDLSARCKAAFPQVTEKTPTRVDGLAARLAELGNTDLAKNDFDAILDELILIAQDEIVASEWPAVVRSAMEQEHNWSSYQAISSKTKGNVYDTAKLVWLDPQSSPDYLIVQTAAAAISTSAFPDFRQCRVAGRPFADEIPGPVVLELASRALMRLEKSISAAAPRLARLPLIHAPVFRFFIPGLYGWSSFHRSRPEWRVAFSASLLSVSIAVLILTFALRSAAVGTGLKVALILSSLVIVVFWFWIFRPPRKSLGRTGVAFALAIIAICSVIALVELLMPWIAELLK
jgi:predicted acylesterase/phospholipase RssA